MKDNEKLEQLQNGYNYKIRLFEVCSIFINIFLSLSIVYNFPLSTLNYLLIIILSWLGADIISGLVHWFADTYGKLDWPIIGNTFIRSFLEHHIEPLSITRHDWIETNGANFFIGIPLLLLLIVFNQYIPDSLIVFFTLINIWTSLTNQFHKWAHTPVPNKVAIKLQKYKVILGHQVHGKHHRYPFDINYNITNGHTNILFEKLKIYRFLEMAIEKILKISPHRNIS